MAAISPDHGQGRDHLDEFDLLKLVTFCRAAVAFDHRLALRPAGGGTAVADWARLVANGIDFAWSFVAGKAALVDRPLADNLLEFVPTTFTTAANRAVELEWPPRIG